MAGHSHNCRDMMKFITTPVTFTGRRFWSNLWSSEQYFDFNLPPAFLPALFPSLSPSLLPSLLFPLPPSLKSSPHQIWFHIFYSYPIACSSDWKAISSEVGWRVNILFLRFVPQCLFIQKMKHQLKSLHVKNTVFSLLLPRQIICLSKGFFLDYSFYYWDLIWISQVCSESYSFFLHHRASLGKCIFLSSKLRERQNPYLDK